MAVLYCGVRRFRKLIIAGADWVAKNRDELNKINVFPVPDGDTGSNMSATLASAARGMEAAGETRLDAMVKAAAWGALMGARGNSGIILSQILSAFSEGIEGRERLFAEDIVLALSRGVKKAYKAVLHPTEGTILTVARETAEWAEEAVKTEKDLARLLDGMVKSARSSVERTPSRLPKLAEAGVVDAGGLGFFRFLEGTLLLLQGQTNTRWSFGDEGLFNGGGREEGDGWAFEYCTEFILEGSRTSPDAMKTGLAPLGDSVVVVGDAMLMRVHIHTGKPEEVLRYASTMGQVSSVKVDDMLVQHTSRMENAGSAKATSVIAIVLGGGLKELFYNAGAELVINGGPTLNPSTADIASAIEKVESSHVIVLPNNRNAYPAVLQAGERSSKNVTVLKTVSVQEGLSALLAYRDDAPAEENVRRMEQAYHGVKSGEVTSACRDAVMSGVRVSSGDSIGIFGGELRCSSIRKDETVVSLVDDMTDGSDEIITLFYGDSIEKAEAEALQAILQLLHKDKTVELYDGGQPYALYLISVE
ncbi:MAG: DAK2 domain-containing protein [Syntrophorhabdales bacterium]